MIPSLQAIRLSQQPQPVTYGQPALLPPVPSGMAMVPNYFVPLQEPHTNGVVSFSQPISLGN